MGRAPVFFNGYHRGMKTWVKVLLGCGVLAVVGVVAVVAVFAIFIHRTMPAATAMATQGRADAKTWAPGHDQKACVDEMLSRADACGSGLQISCEVGAQEFGEECMKDADKSAGFCDGVPKKGDIMATAKWEVAACSAAGRNGNDRCQRTVQAQQEYCAKP